MLPDTAHSSTATFPDPHAPVLQWANHKVCVIGFLLLDGFSLPCFTQALAVLSTANMIRPGAVKTRTFSGNGTEVVSDLGIPIRPDTPLTDVRMAELDVLIVCGGLRTTRIAPPWLTVLLKKLARTPVALGGLWNGAWYLGKAGLLDGYRCAIHPEQRTALSERSPYASVTTEVAVIDRDRLTAATPTGAYHVMVNWLKKQCGQALAEAIADLLNYDQPRSRTVDLGRQQHLSRPLREIIQLMQTNLEESLDPEQLAACVHLSRRQVQRLFREQLSTTPQRYYLRLRITEARRLIQNSSMPITEVAIACGFVSGPHFSKCYRSFFGYPPSREQRYEV